MNLSAQPDSEELVRYSRQIVLREVGGHGQAAFKRAHVTASSKLEALYLAGAGVGTLTVPDQAIADAVIALNPAVNVTVGGDPEEATAAQATLRALATLKNLLMLPTH